MGNLCILLQSWLERDDLVSFYFRFPRYLKVLDGYASCCFCGLVLKVSSLGLGTFREHKRKNRCMLRDSDNRRANHMPLFAENGVEMRPRAVEQRLLFWLGCLRPVMESMPKISAARSIEIELVEGSVWEGFFGLASEIIGTSRLRLRLMVVQIGGVGCFEDVVSHWHSVNQFIPSTNALTR